MGATIETVDIRPSLQDGVEQASAFRRIREINLDNTRDTSAILKIFNDPKNREHIADIWEGMTPADLLEHYRNNNRHGFVAIDNKYRIVGVFDLTRQGYGDINASSVLAGGMLNKLCVDSRFQQQGTGDKLREKAEQTAFQEFKWPNLVAGIILDEQQMEEGRKAEEIALGWGIFVEKFKTTDARGKLFLRNGRWDPRGIFQDNVYIKSTGKYRDVLLIAKTRASWLAEQGVPLEGK